MRRIGIVYSEKKPAWTSCVSILSGLHQACYEYFKNDEIILYDLHLRSPINRVIETSKKILNDQLDKLIFINHAPNPRELLLHLHRFKEDRDLPELFFHIYGDFTFQAQEWFRTSNFLQGEKVAIICASHAQQRLVDNLILNNPQYTDYCPFPINHNIFSYQANLRDDARKKYNFQEDEFIFLYTGRLSLQKNIIELCSDFINFSRQSDIKSKLILAGAFDNIGAPLFNIEYLDGYYFHLYNQFIQKLPQKDQDRIVFIGSQEQNDLVPLYHAADTFISLSLYHDEDFGMSPLEALCCGTPALITDWGGYSSFYDGGNFCQLVGLDIKKEGIIINHSQFIEKLDQASKRQLPSSKKEECAAYYHNKFSLKGANTYLEKIHQTPLKRFPGFNWKLKEISNYIYQDPTKGSFYEEIYSKYISHQT